MTEEIEEIRATITTCKLSMSRIPPKAYKAFIELSNSDFCGDYGLTLKFLMDLHDGMIITGVEHLEAQVKHLGVELERLKQIVFEKKEEKPIKKMMDGSNREVKKDDDKVQ